MNKYNFTILINKIISYEEKLAHIFEKSSKKAEEPLRSIFLKEAQLCVNNARILRELSRKTVIEMTLGLIYNAKLNELIKGLEKLFEDKSIFHNNYKMLKLLKYLRSVYHEAIKSIRHVSPEVGYFMYEILKRRDNLESKLNILVSRVNKMFR